MLLRIVLYLSFLIYATLGCICQEYPSVCECCTDDCIISRFWTHGFSLENGKGTGISGVSIAGWCCFTKTVPLMRADAVEEVLPECAMYTPMSAKLTSNVRGWHHPFQT